MEAKGPDGQLEGILVALALGAFAGRIRLCEMHVVALHRSGFRCVRLVATGVTQHPQRLALADPIKFMPERADGLVNQGCGLSSSTVC